MAGWKKRALILNRRHNLRAIHVLWHGVTFIWAGSTTSRTNGTQPWNTIAPLWQPVILQPIPGRLRRMACPPPTSRRNGNKDRNNDETADSVAAGACVCCRRAMRAASSFLTNSRAAISIAAAAIQACSQDASSGKNAAGIQRLQRRICHNRRGGDGESGQWLRRQISSQRVARLSLQQGHARIPEREPARQDAGDGRKGTVA